MKVSPRTLKLLAAGATLTAVVLYADAAQKTMRNAPQDYDKKEFLSRRIAYWWYSMGVKMGWIKASVPRCPECGMG